MKYYLLLLGISLGLVACQSEGKSGNESADREVTASNPVDISSLEKQAIYLKCREVTQPTDEGAHFQVSAVIKEDEVEVGDLRNCSEVDSATIASWEVDGDVIYALGGPAGDMEEYIFIARVGVGGTRLAVRKATRSLTQVDGPLEFRSLAVFDNEDLSSEGGMNKVDLVGSYVHSGDSLSYVLFIGLKDKDVTGQLFQVDGPLPEKEQIMSSLGSAPPQSLGFLRVNLSERAFNSDLGPGTFSRGTPPSSITLEDVPDEGGDPLELERLD